MTAKRYKRLTRPHIPLETLRGMVAVQGREQIGRSTLRNWLQRLGIVPFQVLNKETGKYYAAVWNNQAAKFCRAFTGAKHGRIGTPTRWEQNIKPT